MPKRKGLGINLSSVKRTIGKSHRKENGIKVRKMLAAVMEHQQTRHMNGSGTKVSDTTGAQVSAAEGEDFYSTGRTGRRNALPDILGENAHVTSSDLPARLQALSTTSDQDKINTTVDSEPGPSTRPASQ